MDVRVNMGDTIDPFQLANGFETVCVFITVIGYRAGAGLGRRWSPARRRRRLPLAVRVQLHRRLPAVPARPALRSVFVNLGGRNDKYVPHDNSGLHRAGVRKNGSLASTQFIKKRMHTGYTEGGPTTRYK